MITSASDLLQDLERHQTDYGGDNSRRKLDLLCRLNKRRLPSAESVVRLHEVLCFLRAYPDDPKLLRQVESMLRAFSDRRDLRRFRRSLQDSGIAGTDIKYEFFVKMAQWLARCWPDRLTVDWPEFTHGKRLENVLHLLALYSETPALDEYAFSVQEWIDRMRGPSQTDATFLIERIAALPLDIFFREYFYEDLALPLRLSAGPETPSRTLAKAPGRKVVYQKGPLVRRRPDLRRALKVPPRAVRTVSPRRARVYLDMACAAMVTRSRDLDVFVNGDPQDVRIIDCGDGLEFVAIGANPERRLMFEAVYGFLTLKNGVPIGYVLNSALFGSVEVAYNMFETFRGAEAAHIYGRLLAALHHLFSADAFTIYPYQLGHQNDEALQSGAWWFYQKLGFRARDPQVLRLMRQEERRMNTDPQHRSSIATLRRLSCENVYYEKGRRRQDVIGVLPLADLGLRITDYLAGRFGADRARGEKICAREAAQLLGLRGLEGWTASERQALTRWGPLILLLPGVRRWDATSKRELAVVVRAKGGRRESDFVRAFDRHRRLRTAVRRLALSPDQAG